MGDVFATKPSDEFQSNRLVLAGDAAPIEKKIMDTDIKRFVEVHQKSLIKMYINENIKLYENRGSQEQSLSWQLCRL